MEAINHIINFFEGQKVCNRCDVLLTRESFDAMPAKLNVHLICFDHQVFVTRHNSIKC